MNREPVNALLADFEPDPKSPHPLPVQKAVLLARRLQEEAAKLQTASERRQQAELDRLLQNPADKSTLVQLTDQAFRSRDPSRAVEHLIHILDVQGVPRCFSPVDRTLLKGFQSFGAYAPGVALPLVKEHMHKETANVILPGEQDMLTAHLRERAREGVRMNVNFLGEAILSEVEAERRLQQYIRSLEWPEIEVVSVKISTLYSQVSALAREHTVKTLCDRLERLLLAAAQHPFIRPNGTTAQKFVYLDMEEYRDKQLTAAAFMRTLERPGLEQVAAGIALQSYLPDSFRTLRRIQTWAQKRVANGGARITVRIVKGANMEMERVEASLHGWPQAPFKTKGETDANYKRMLHECLKAENLAAMNVGIASHNLFDLAYGLVLAQEHDAFDLVQFEMLEGMANHQRRALFEACHNLLLYAPACHKENFVNAIGYLIRRLDENTGPENFLRHAFKLQVGSTDWEGLERDFLASFDKLDSLSDAPRRGQNRQQRPTSASPAVGSGWQNLVNEPDTDFALPQNSEWAEQIVTNWKPRCDAQATRIPIIVNGESIFDGRETRDCLDPSRPGVVVGHYPKAVDEDAARAIECAVADPDGWRSRPARERGAILGRVAQEIRQARADLLGAAMADGGKIIPESDPEVSEAVDFLEFYRESALWWQELPTLKARGTGVVVVIPPWNFPIAIPCGGVAAALAAGNTVILKPSSDTVLVASQLCQCFWRAGVSKKVLQFLPCSGEHEARKLVHHPKVNAVILTGGTATARTLLGENPRLNLFAETGGKNATIVTALADRDQAIKHVLHSAFSHTGQKCSATSLLLLEAEVYDDPQFRRTLQEAAQSLIVGSAWDLETRIGPLIRPPRGPLESALRLLDPGEEWAIEPHPIGGNPNLWSPGVKYGVRPGSNSHLTELFGPVLSVMRFDKLSEAVALVNQTGYGLTSGLESLDEREWDFWKERIRAGNLYINRVTTGAVVLRQPFGGMGKSSFGPGMKAGGPNYVTQFMQFENGAAPEQPILPTESAPSSSLSSVTASSKEEDARQPRSPAASALHTLCGELRRRSPDLGPGGEREADRIATAVESYQRAFHDEFGKEHDHFKLVGQDNFRRYLPLHSVRIRVHPDDSTFDVFARVCAAHTLGCRITVSVPPDFSSSTLLLLEGLTESWAGAIEFVEESDAALARILRDRQTDRIRYAAPDRVPIEVLQAAAETGIALVGRPVLMEGRLELLWYLQEQSLSIDYHRYGNLGARADEPRAEVS